VQRPWWRSLAYEESRRAEVFLRLVLIMRPAAELDVVDGRRAARRIGDNVMELHESWLGATPLRSYERTATAVASRPRASPPKECGANVPSQRVAGAAA
jgi:hypothetical protein